MKRFISRVERPVVRLRRPGHFSIRTSLIALVTACLLPAIGAIAILVYQDHLQSQEVIGRETILQARAVMATIDRELAAVEASLQVVAASQRLAPAKTRLAQLQSEIRSPLVLDTVLFDRDGKRLPHAAAEAGTPAAATTVPRQLLHVFESGEPLVSTLIEGPDRQLALGITVPVRRGDEIVSALTARLSPAQLGRILEREALPKG